MCGYNFVNCCFSDIEAMTMTESEMLNETTRESPLPLKPVTFQVFINPSIPLETLNGTTGESPLPPTNSVTFQVSTNTSIPLDKISSSNDSTIRGSMRKSSLVSVSELKLTRYRVAVAFGICCIVTLFLLPIIFYYVEDNSGTAIGFDSFVMNIGIVNVSQVCIYIATFCINPRSYMTISYNYSYLQ